MRQLYHWEVEVEGQQQAEILSKRQDRDTRWMSQEAKVTGSRSASAK